MKTANVFEEMPMAFFNMAMDLAHYSLSWQNAMLNSYCRPCASPACKIKHTHPALKKTSATQSAEK